MDRRTLEKHAKERLKTLKRARRDPRFQKTMGRLLFARLLDHPKVLPYFETVPVEDVLWAGNFEPRILELLPAILLKKPKVFSNTGDLPDDLKEILSGVRKGKAVKPFRGIPVRDYMKWIPLLGHRNKTPSILKTFRFNQEDVQVLEELKKKLEQSEISVIRQALRNLATETLPKSPRSGSTSSSAV
jgi:hypothetical protein